MAEREPTIGSVVRELSGPSDQKDTEASQLMLLHRARAVAEALCELSSEEAGIVLLIVELLRGEPRGWLTQAGQVAISPDGP